MRSSSLRPALALLGLLLVIGCDADEPEPDGPADAGAVDLAKDAAILETDVGATDLGAAEDAGAEDTGTLDSGSDAGTAAGLLRLEGEALPSFAVEVHVGTEVFAVTAGTDGRFSREIPVDGRGPAVVWLEARAPAPNPQRVLASVLDTVDNLLARAGPDRVLDVLEAPGNHLSALTTARFGMIWQVHGAAVPDTRADLQIADRRANEAPGPDFVVTAALIDLALQDPLRLPATATTTLSLATDGALSQVFSESLTKDEQDAAVGALIARRELFRPSWEAATELRNVEYISDLRRQRRGAVALRRGQRWDFQTTQNGILRQGAASDGKLVANTGFTWLRSGPAIEVSFAAPALRTTAVPDVDTVLAAINNPALEETIRFLYEQRGPLEVPLEQTGSVLLRAPGDVDVDWVIEEQRWTYRFTEAFAGTGLSIPDAPAPDVVLGRLWRDASGVAFDRFSDAQLRGKTWVLRIYGPSLNPSFFTDSFGSGEDIVMAAVVTLNDDPTQSVTLRNHGFAPAPSMTWSLTPTGQLELRYADGMLQTFGLYAEVGGEVGLFSTLTRPEGINVEYMRAAEVDTSLALTASELLTPMGRYWQNTINREPNTPPPGAEVAARELFGFRFLPADAAERVFYSVIDAAFTIEDFWTYRLSQGEVEISHPRSSTDFRSCAGSIDGSCILFRRRTWTPLALHNGWLYVLERDERRPPDFQWDGQAWTNDAGEPLGDGEFAWLIAPRINAYFVRDLSL